jgi:UDP-N-acetylmuramoyl-tripeptide--D-alanyl-D-alanine ligase
MDAYNANPSSMNAAISHFLQLATTKKKALILGDMFELGGDSAKEHAEIGRSLKEAEVEWIVLYGENMQHALPYLPKAYYFTDKFSLHNWLIDKNLDNYFILVKGSRGVGLESILTVLPTSER